MKYYFFNQPSLLILTLALLLRSNARQDSAALTSGKEFKGSPMHYANLLEWQFLKSNHGKKSKKPKIFVLFQFSSFHFSRSVMSNSLWPHESQHAMPPCPSTTPRVYPNPCPLSRWCRPAISSSVVPFSTCPQSFPVSGSFPMSQPKYWSFSFNISPSNEHPGLISFRMDWLDLLAVQGTLKSLLQKASILRHSAFFIVQLSHPYMTTGKTIALTR